MLGKCAKQETIAIIENNGQYWVGTNYCNDAKENCPRKYMPTGVGYELCIDVCKQSSHAEVDACIKAGENANGATLYLIGHTYCCDNCKSVINTYGIKEVVIGKLPYSFINKIVMNEFNGEQIKSILNIIKNIHNTFNNIKYIYKNDEMINMFIWELEQNLETLQTSLNLLDI